MASYFGQVEEEVLGGFLHGSGGAELAARAVEVDGVHQFAAFVALVAAGVVIAAERARPLHETIRQESDSNNNKKMSKK